MDIEDIVTLMIRDRDGALPADTFESIRREGIPQDMDSGRLHEIWWALKVLQQQTFITVNGKEQLNRRIDQIMNHIFKR